MVDQNYSIFDLPHSLPCSAHTTALATRTPSGPPKVNASKYMPAYGGMLELPGTKLKQNGLRDGIPFFPNPYSVWVSNPKQDHSHLNEPPGPNCLATASYLRKTLNESFTVIRALSSTLYIDIVTSIPCYSNLPKQVESSTYAQVPYAYNIKGLKYCDQASNHVIVGFKEGIKLVKLNDQYEIPRRIIVRDNDDTDDEDSTMLGTEMDAINITDQSAINFVGSFPAQRHVSVVDACMSVNQNILNIASIDRKNLCVRVYDISRPKNCISVISRGRDDEAKIRLSMSTPRTNRKRSLRSFVPVGPALEEMHQIDCNPGHLVQSMITTSTKVSEIDPRVNRIVEHYADKFMMNNVSPTELFRQTEFSRVNDYQLYLMSNEKIRVLDRRFRSKDMNILDHMLDSSTCNMMKMKLIKLTSSNVETICLSSLGRLCFVSFDQSQRTHSLIQSAGPLVNPVATHQPIHEPSPIEYSGHRSDELFGLAVSTGKIFEDRDVIFNTLQLNRSGKVYIRGYPKVRDRAFEAIETLPRLRFRKFAELTPGNNQSNPDIDPTKYKFTDAIETPGRENERSAQLDESSLPNKIRGRMTSKRARTKYDAIVAEAALLIN